MEQFVQWLISAPVIAFSITLIIFIITLVLVIKRLIGFVVTVILLAICLLAGYLIFNPELLKDMLKAYSSEEPVEKEKAQSRVKEKFHDIYENVIDKVQSHSEKLKNND